MISMQEWPFWDSFFYQLDGECPKRICPGHSGRRLSDGDMFHWIYITLNIIVDALIQATEIFIVESYCLARSSFRKLFSACAAFKGVKPRI